MLIAVWIATNLACSSSPTSPGVAVTTAEAAVAAPNTATKSEFPANPSEFLASGPIIVEDQVDVSAQRDGVVAKVLAEPGTQVRKGQLLAALDDRQITADLEAARAKTRSTENDLKNWEAEAKVLDSDYARAEKMWEAQIIPKEQLEHAKYKAESDQWDVKRVSELLANAKQVERSLELELEKTQITAPFNGVVARRYIRAGQSVARNDRLFWVTAVAPMRIRVTLPERFLECGFSTSLDCQPEDIRVHAMIVAELKLGNIEGHVFAAHLVERADDAALEDPPETFNRSRVHEYRPSSRCRIAGLARANCP